MALNPTKVSDLRSQLDLKRLEAMADDQSVTSGFLTRGVHSEPYQTCPTDSNNDYTGDYFVEVDYDQFATNPEYWQKFRRFASAYLTLYASDTSDLTKEIQRLYQINSYGEANAQVSTVSPSNFDFSATVYTGDELRVATINGYKMYEGDVVGAFIGSGAISYYIENVIGHTWPDPWARKPALIDTLVNSKAEVVNLQEMMSPDFLSGQVMPEVNALREAAGKLPFNFVHYADHMDEGVTALALLSVYPITESKFVPGVWQGSEPSRCQLAKWTGYIHGFGHSQIDVNGVPVEIYNVHRLPREPVMESVRESSEYDDGLWQQREVGDWELVNDILQNNLGDHPIVIAGDLNSNPNQKGYERFDAVLSGFKNSLIESVDQMVYRGDDSTFRGEARWNAEPDNADLGMIDHIFTHGATNLYASVDRSVENFSDHSGVEAVIQLPTASELSLLSYDRVISSEDHKDLLGLMEYVDGFPIHSACQNLASGVVAQQRDNTLSFIQELLPVPEDEFVVQMRLDDFNKFEEGMVLIQSIETYNSYH